MATNDTPNLPDTTTDVEGITLAPAGDTSSRPRRALLAIPLLLALLVAGVVLLVPTGDDTSTEAAQGPAVEVSLPKRDSGTVERRSTTRDRGAKGADDEAVDASSADADDESTPDEAAAAGNGATTGDQDSGTGPDTGAGSPQAPAAPKAPGTTAPKATPTTSAPKPPAPKPPAPTTTVAPKPTTTTTQAPKPTTTTTAARRLVTVRSSEPLPRDANTAGGIGPPGCISSIISYSAGQIVVVETWSDNPCMYARFTTSLGGGGKLDLG